MHRVTLPLAKLQNLLCMSIPWLTVRYYGVPRTEEGQHATNAQKRGGRRTQSRPNKPPKARADRQRVKKQQHTIQLCGCYLPTLSTRFHIIVQLCFKLNFIDTQILRWLQQNTHHNTHFNIHDETLARVLPFPHVGQLVHMHHEKRKYCHTLRHDHGTGMAAHVTKNMPHM